MQPRWTCCAPSATTRPSCSRTRAGTRLTPRAPCRCARNWPLQGPSCTLCIALLCGAQQSLVHYAPSLLDAHKDDLGGHVQVQCMLHVLEVLRHAGHASRPGLKALQVVPRAGRCAGGGEGAAPERGHRRIPGGAGCAQPRRGGAPPPGAHRGALAARPRRPHRRAGRPALVAVALSAASSGT